MDESNFNVGGYKIRFLSDSHVVDDIDISTEYNCDEFVKKENGFFQKHIDNFTTAHPDAYKTKQGEITIVFNSYYAYSYNGPVSRGKNIFYTIVNSSRPDDVYYNGYLRLLGALANCDTTKNRIMNLAAILSGQNWYLYNGYDMFMISCGDIIPKTSHETYPHITTEGEDTFFWILKNSEPAYQSSDIIVKVADNEERKDALSEFQRLMEEVRVKHSLAKDRFLIGVLTTYTEDLVDYAKSYGSNEDMYEIAVDMIVYTMNYRSSFDKRHMDALVHHMMQKPMDQQPTNMTYILSIDIISSTTVVFTLNDQMIATVSIPEDWYKILMKINGIGIEDPDE